MNSILKRAIHMTCAGAAILGLIGVVSCNDDNVTVVNVTEREYIVTPDNDTVSAGKITFHVTNTGTVGHEFLVIKTNLAPGSLPKNVDGSYLENGTGTVLVDEIDLVTPGNSKDLTLDLSAGKYVLICNMVHISGVTVEAHYSLGMYHAFTVD